MNREKSSRQKPAQILIVDDHPMVREGLTLRLSTQRDLTVCGEAATELEALTQVQALNPDLVLVDITLKSGNGIDLIKRIRSQHPDVKLLVISGHRESLYAERALRAGALGYVNKQETNEKILDAVRTVLSGRLYVVPEIAQRLMQRGLGGSDGPGSPIEQLTDRELEVFGHIGEGRSSGSIAKVLHLSTHTIDTHRENIKRKLDIASAGELTRAAVQWMLERDSPTCRDRVQTPGKSPPP